MKAFIQCNQDGEPYNVNAYIAKTGFKSLGYDVFNFQAIEEITDSDPESITVGGVGTIRDRLEVLGFPPVQEEIEYPSSLLSFFKRKIWTSTLKAIALEEENWGIFIKPKHTKVFEGRVIQSIKDLIGLDPNSTQEIWCSEVIPLVTEWRCFVRYGKLLDVRFYKGLWDSRLDVGVVEAAIVAYKGAPAAYCLDFGVDSDGNHYLVEVNDGHSLGTYGIGAISYAKFLSARWAEMTHTQDYLNF